MMTPNDFTKWQKEHAYEIVKYQSQFANRWVEFWKRVYSWSLTETKK